MSKNFDRLVIDIGGTNIRLGLVSGAEVYPEHVMNYQIDHYPGLADVIQLYLNTVAVTHNVEEVAIDVATAVTGDKVKLTNHDWQFSIRAVREQFGFAKVKVVNDFTGLALSIPWLRADELQQVGGGQPVPGGGIGLLGAGTGLGVSGLVHTDSDYFPVSGEGGHVSLGARNARELAIFTAFWDKYGHMSAERLLSGTGLTEYYQVIRRLDGLDDQPLRPAEISTRAIDGSCASCVEVMAAFCEWLGVVAADVALTVWATGGIYIGGGIVPKLGDYFVRSGFRQAFETKGRYSAFLTTVPVFVIHAEQPTLRGTAWSLEDKFAGLGINCPA